MPRNYTRTTQRGEGYTKENLSIAIGEVKSGIRSLRMAAKKYSIPYSTLQCHLTGRRGVKSETGGRPTALKKKDEEKLVHYLKSLEKSGFGLSRKELLEVVQQYVLKNKIPTPFKNGKPGKDWFILFRKRHRLSVKKPQSVEYARKKQTDPFIINDYFNLLHSTLEKFNLFNRPHLVWNLDETSICTDPSKTKVVGAKGKPCSRTTGGSGKENITCLVAASASGEKSPPLVIFKGLNLWTNWVPEPKENDCPDMTFAASKNGWISSEIFLNFLKNNLVPALPEDRPVLLIYDGHATHVTDDVIDFAKSQNIEILKLPAHTSHLLQPLDLSVFKSLKVMWDEKLCVWQRRNAGRRISKKEFAQLFGKIWNLVCSDVIRSGFKKGGIMPFSREVITPEKYDRDIWERYLRYTQEKEEPTKVHDENLNSNSLKDKNEHMERDRNENIPEPTRASDFEEILLDTIRSNRNIGTQERNTRKKIASGAEVITSIEAEKIVLNRKAKVNKKNESVMQGHGGEPSSSGLQGNKKAEKRLKRRKKPISDDSSSESADSEKPHYIETDDDEDPISETESDIDFNELNNAENKKEENQKEIVSGTFVTVLLKSEKREKIFTAQITEVLDSNKGIYECSFMREAIGKKYPENCYVFPEKEDKSIVYSHEISKCLNNPTVKRGHFIFD